MCARKSKTIETHAVEKRVRVCGVPFDMRSRMCKEVKDH